MFNKKELLVYFNKVLFFIFYIVNFIFLLFIFCFIDNIDQSISINIKKKKYKTYILLRYSSLVICHVFVLSKPNRIIVDLKSIKPLVFDFKKVFFKGSLITNVSKFYVNNNILRLIFNINRMVSVKVKFVLDFFCLNQKLFIYLISNKDFFKKKEIIYYISDFFIRYFNIRNLYRNLVIILDPGHGGKDPGASGLDSSKEKDITLIIAKYLKELIDNQVGMHAFLTRKKDSYISLRDRLLIAKRYNADLLISIHVNSCLDKKSSGALVFTLSNIKKDRKYLKYLSINKILFRCKKYKFSRINSNSNLLTSVCSNFYKIDTMRISFGVAKRVLYYLNNVIDLHNSMVEQARFMILKSLDIPSILIEIGFISNPKEEKFLNVSFYRMKIAYAIFSGLKCFFEENVPFNSKIAMLYKMGYYFINKI
ncbi:N-acetylmuramoyl-L-alanine amidase [Candidatus Legionella polyplacis]|uniref:N-acetylmuramoyl-L-alanine amidase n=1 Tax=Candidatus Legionella polyplacis TaxID=2005262 RepID=A0ABZ2H128_9GAMM